jgi:pyridoxal 5'-phosphate synthase pdxS subunit
MAKEIGTFALKAGLAQMLKGGVIMDVVTAEHARIAEDGGAVAVMALERVPADIRAYGGVARMSDPALILEIMETFVCGCRNLGEALRRIGEGAAMIRTKGEAGTGDVVEAVRHARDVIGAISHLETMRDDELMAYAKDIGAPYMLVKETKELSSLPVVNFAAGGIATPADAALMRAKAIVEAVTHYENPEILAEISKGLGDPMVGIGISDLPETERLAVRGW